MSYVWFENRCGLWITHIIHPKQKSKGDNTYNFGDHIPITYTGDNQVLKSFMNDTQCKINCAEHSKVLLNHMSLASWISKSKEVCKLRPVVHVVDSLAVTTCRILKGIRTKQRKKQSSLKMFFWWKLVSVTNWWKALSGNKKVLSIFDYGSSEKEDSTTTPKRQQLSRLGSSYIHNRNKCL